jgi:uncharacterized Fe-S cluster-containing radical SAM superfamily protein
MDPLASRKNLIPLLTTLLRKKVPGQLVIQLTDRCNARCPQCGMRVTQNFARTKIPTDDVKKILDKAAQRGVKVVSFTGGEPFLLLDELAELITYAGQAGIQHIRTGTNGFVFAGSHAPGFQARVERIAAKLAATPLRTLWISIDSAVPEVHEKMRGFPGLIKGIERALPVFHRHGIYPSANLGINRNIAGEAKAKTQEVPPRGEDDPVYREFRIAFSKFYRFVLGLGFTIVNSCYPMSVENGGNPDELDAVYGASSDEDLVSFTASEKAGLFRALLHTIPDFRSRIRIFSPQSALYALYRQYTDNSSFPYPCRGGKDFFFIDSQSADTFPCGYRGHESLGKYWEGDLKQPEQNGPCHRCDWECFRDPSELFGPLLHGVSNPLGLMKRIRRDRDYFRLWVDDLRYYRACDFFDGRRPPNHRDMSPF